MALEIPKKPFEGVWWKYGLALAGVQQLCWYLLAFRNAPDIKISFILQSSYVVYLSFIVGAFLPFVIGRLGLTRLMWPAFIGYLLGNAAYFILALYEPVRQLHVLLPFISYAQLYTAFLSIGLVIELGHYVYRKVFEE